MQSHSHKLWLYTLAAASGLLQTAIFPNLDWYWLSWIALTPLLYALLTKPDVEIIAPGARGNDSGLTPKQGFFLGYFCGVIWYGGTCYWVYHVMNTYGGLSPVVSAVLLVLFCLYLGLYHGLFGALLVRAGRNGIGRALLAAPFLWVAVELARARVTGFPWDLLGTTQVNNAIFSPVIATTAGVYGISFLLVIVNVLLTKIFFSQRRTAIASFIAAAAVVGSFSLGESITMADKPRTHTAVLVQQNLPLDMKWSPEVFDQTMGKLADLSKEAAKKDDPTPRLIVWPESPGPFWVADPKFRAWMSTLAQDRDAYVIVGSLGTPEGPVHQDGPIYNSAVLISPSGQLVSRYDKVHLVPFGEYVPFQNLFFFAKNLTKEVGTFSSGNERKVFNLSQSDARGKVGVFICYESVFPDEIRQFAANGAEVFVNISNDGWFGDTGAGRQHLNMARMRAMENRRWLLRATNTGITTSIDPTGRLHGDFVNGPMLTNMQSAPTNVQTTLRAPYAYISDTTFYTRHGDWFAYACAIISWALVFFRFNFRLGVLR